MVGNEMRLCCVTLRCVFDSFALRPAQHEKNYHPNNNGNDRDGSGEAKKQRKYLLVQPPWRLCVHLRPLKNTALEERLQI